MCDLRDFFVLILETPTLRRSRNRPIFVKISRPVPLAPIIVAHVVGLGKGVTWPVSGLQMDPCVSSSGAHREHFLLLGTHKKNRGEIATSARADTRRDAHTQREAAKRHTPT